MDFELVLDQVGRVRNLTMLAVCGAVETNAARIVIAEDGKLQAARSASSAIVGDIEDL